MARIRSIHPGFFTDEDVASVTPEARLLLIGIGVEADDKGVFPWKPVTLKMRIFPADAIDVAPLMDQLIDAGLLMQFDANGRKYGAVRNFRVHQRPKSPNDIHPKTEEVLKFVGLADDSSPDDAPNDATSKPEKGEIDAPETASFPPKGEIAPQMEDGGCSLEIDKSISWSFADFWKNWPNKVSKPAAQRAFKKLSAVNREKAVTLSSAWFKHWRSTNRDASAIHASTFLNNHRWEDEGFTPTKIDQSSKLAFYASLINGDKFIAPSTVSASLCRELIEAGLVTPERMNQRGIAA